MILAADQRADLIRLQLADLNPDDNLMIEATGRTRGFFQTAIHGIPGNLLDASDGRLVHTLDAHSGDFIESGSAMLEPVIDSATVPAKGPAATLASEATTFTPSGLVKSISNDLGSPGIGLRTLRVWTAETLHGT